MELEAEGAACRYAQSPGFPAPKITASTAYLERPPPRVANLAHRNVLVVIGRDKDNQR